MAVISAQLLCLQEIANSIHISACYFRTWNVTFEHSVSKQHSLSLASSIGNCCLWLTLLTTPEEAWYIISVVSVCLSVRR